MGITKGEEREKGTEEILKEILAENFPKLMSDTKSKIPGAQRIQSRINTNKFTCRHIIPKL